MWVIVKYGIRNRIEKQKTRPWIRYSAVLYLALIYYNIKTGPWLRYAAVLYPVVTTLYHNIAPF